MPKYKFRSIPNNILDSAAGQAEVKGAAVPPCMGVREGEQRSLSHEGRGGVGEREIGSSHRLLVGDSPTPSLCYVKYN